MFDLRPRVCGFGEPRPVRTLPPVSIEIAPMVPGRVAQCALIDRMSFGVPWTEADFHKATARLGRYGVVALYGPYARVVGYAICECDEATACLTVARFAVDENLRRRGVGRRMFARIAADAAFTDHRVVAVPIPETDVHARRFLQAIGFRAEGVLRGHFGDRDAYLMTKATGVCNGK